MRVPPGITAFDAWKQYLSAWLDHRAADMVDMLTQLTGLHIQEDPEAMFLEGWLLCDAGDPDAGLACIERAVAKGYCAAPTLSSSRHFDALRGGPRFERLVTSANDARERALSAFREGGGARLLGSVNNDR
jgi:hypothetical protein